MQQFKAPKIGSMWRFDSTVASTQSRTFARRGINLIVLFSDNNWMVNSCEQVSVYAWRALVQVAGAPRALYDNCRYNDYVVPVFFMNKKALLPLVAFDEEGWLEIGASDHIVLKPVKIL